MAENETNRLVAYELEHPAQGQAYWERQRTFALTQGTLELRQTAQRLREQADRIDARLNAIEADKPDQTPQDALETRVKMVGYLLADTAKDLVWMLANLNLDTLTNRASDLRVAHRIASLLSGIANKDTQA